jgi:hypothetical protein
MFGISSMRKIQTKQVDTGHGQSADRFIVATCRTNGCNDFSANQARTFVTQNAQAGLSGHVRCTPSIWDLLVMPYGTQSYLIIVVSLDVRSQPQAEKMRALNKPDRKSRKIVLLSDQLRAGFS